MKTITLILFSLILNSCGTTQESTNSLKQDMNTKTLQGKFIVSSIDNTVMSDKELTLNFDTDAMRVFGYSGCNQFSGTYTVTGDQISFSQLLSTKMFCQDNATETSFLKALENTTNFKLEDSRITLLNNKTEVLNAKQVLDTTSSIKQNNDPIF